MNDRLLALKLFVRAARVANFSKAGRELGLSQPSASRLIAALEAEIGARLFSRTTRTVVLTEAGTAYLTRIETILAALDEADHEARGTGELRGMLRVGATSSFALREIIPRLPRFQSAHPALQIELLSSDKYQDLVAEGIDVAIRHGSLPDSSAIARKVMDDPRILVASWSYIMCYGTPLVPAGLAEHSIIACPTQAASTLSFSKDGRVASVRVKSQLSISINEGAIEAAKAGLGIAATSRSSVKAELQSGALVRILSDWDFGSLDVSALFVSGKAIKPSARAFADFLLEEFRPRSQTTFPPAIDTIALLGRIAT